MLSTEMKRAKTWARVMIQDDALGLAGGACGVDEGGEVVSIRQVAAAFDLFVGDAASRGDQLVEVSQVDLPDVLHLGEFGMYLVETGKVVGSFADEGDRSGVADVPLQLGWCGCLVDGNHDCTGEPDGEVDQGPLVPRLAHECDLVARLDAGCDEALGECLHLTQEFARTDIGPAAIARRK
jgi:hypothetical protein